MSRDFLFQYPASLIESIQDEMSFEIFCYLAPVIIIMVLVPIVIYFIYRKGKDIN